MRRAAGLALALLWTSAAAAAPLEAGDLTLIGALPLGKDMAVDGARFGGISGADYDAKTDRWLMISDDRSEHAPARFYVGQLDYDAAGVRALRLERQVRLPGAASERIDGEALRIDPQDGMLVWATEGDAERGFDPAVRRMNRDGAALGAWPSPAAFRFDAEGKRGPRRNQTFEGLSFSPDGRALWLSMEGPLVQDGAPSSPTNGALTRITRLDREGRVAAQYAYPLDPLPAVPERRGDNGVTEILALDDRRLLVLERAGIEDASGHFTFHGRLYVADIEGAEDVAGRDSLAGAPVRTLAKRLLIDFDRVAAPKANLEAMAWGKPLADGRRTLVLFADDNFAPDQPGLVLVLALGAPPAALLGIESPVIPAESPLAGCRAGTQGPPHSLNLLGPGAPLRCGRDDDVDRGPRSRTSPRPTGAAAPGDWRRPGRR